MTARIVKTMPPSGNGKFYHRDHRNKKGRQDRAFTNYNSNKQYKRKREALMIKSISEE